MHACNQEGCEKDLEEDQTSKRNGKYLQNFEVGLSTLYGAASEITCAGTGQSPSGTAYRIVDEASTTTDLLASFLDVVLAFFPP